MKHKSVVALLALISAAIAGASPAGAAETFTFGPSTLALASFGYATGGWQVDQHPRQLADVNGDGYADIVGFGWAGAYVSRGGSNGTFTQPQLAVPSYGANGWSVTKHPRHVGDINNDKRADIVGFADNGTYVSLGTDSGTFTTATLVLPNFGYNLGWREQQPRLLGDVNGDNLADIVGFADNGTWVSLGGPNGSFTPAILAVPSYGYNYGSHGWDVSKHPRLLGDVNGDGRADIVGFADDGVYVSISDPIGRFSPPTLTVANYGYNAGGWRVDQHPRQLADVDGDKRADIVGFGWAGAYVSRGGSNGTFTQPQLAVPSYGANGWSVTKHPRHVGDVNGDKRADIVGFADNGTYVSLGTDSGTFTPAMLATSDYGYNVGWREQQPRLLGDVNKDGFADIVGFADRGTYLSLAIPTIR